MGTAVEVECASELIEQLPARLKDVSQCICCCWTDFTDKEASLSGIDCEEVFPDDEMKAYIKDAKIPHCKRKGCNGLVKPDIVFFGEAVRPILTTYSHCFAV